MNRPRPLSARLSILAALAPALFAAPVFSQSSTVTYSGEGLGLILFTGMNQSSEITFSSNTVDFEITNANVPSLDGLTATIVSSTAHPLAVLGGPNGSFISTSLVQIPNGPTLEEQTAPVTGVGLLSITDGQGKTFTADITWNDLVTSSVVGFPTLGSSGELISTSNTTPIVPTPNLSDFSYDGSNPGLIDLTRGEGAFETLSFQFEPGELLTQLLNPCSTSSTTFSDSVISEPFIAIPEPAGWAAAVGIAAGALALFRRRLAFRTSP